jgi:hypothetical protein
MPTPAPEVEPIPEVERLPAPLPEPVAQPAPHVNLGPTIEHARIHAQNGPFVSIDAVAAGTAPGAPQDVSTAHQIYVPINLVGQGAGEQRTYSGALRFRPTQAGPWAIITTDGEVALLDSEGRAVTATLTQTIERPLVTRGGLRLRTVRTFQLHANAAYTIEFRAGRSALAALIAERVAPAPAGGGGWSRP